jgi:hypothetical protein
MHGVPRSVRLFQAARKCLEKPACMCFYRTFFVCVLVEFYVVCMCFYEVPCVLHVFACGLHERCPDLVGFEPTISLDISIFKTDALNQLSHKSMWNLAKPKHANPKKSSNNSIQSHQIHKRISKSGN